MGIEGYERKAKNSFLLYEFYSEGPKGRIKKAIRFEPVHVEDAIMYLNLSFGDWNEEKDDIDDKAVSDNNDWEKILVTVGQTVVEFIKHFPHAHVIAEGSTRARTRLYQMGINSYWNEISQLLNIDGYTKAAGWQPFSKGVNYESFIASRKKN